MISKIAFLIAILLTVGWIVLYLAFDTFPPIHIIAVLAVISFIISYFTTNKDD